MNTFVLLVYSFVSILGFVPYAIVIYSIFRVYQQDRRSKGFKREDEDKVKNGIRELVKLKSHR